MRRAFIAIASAAFGFCAILAGAKVSLTPDPLVVQIQDQIASTDSPAGYYSTTYRKDENLYWKNLPVWMRRDANHHRVTRVLDIGCGYGTLLAFAMEVYHAKGDCMDVTHYLPEFGKIRGIDFTAGNVQLDPIPAPGVFDVIIMTEVLEHFNFDPLPTMRKIHAALAPTGIFFLSTPDSDEWGRQNKYYSRLSDLPPADPSKKFIDDHIWVYNRSELLRLVKESGFQIVEFGYSPGVGHRHFNVELKAAR